MIYFNHTVCVFLAGTVVLLFVACWSLSAFRTIVTQYALMDVPWDVTNASRLLLVANSAVNPVIYALWKTDVRREFKILLKSNSPRGHTAGKGRKAEQIKQLDKHQQQPKDDAFCNESVNSPGKVTEKSVIRPTEGHVCLGFENLVAQVDSLV